MSKLSKKEIQVNREMKVFYYLDREIKRISEFPLVEERNLDLGLKLSQYSISIPLLNIEIHKELCVVIDDVVKKLKTRKEESWRIAHAINDIETLKDVFGENFNLNKDRTKSAISHVTRNKQIMKYFPKLLITLMVSLEVYREALMREYVTRSVYNEG